MSKVNMFILILSLSLGTGVYAQDCAQAGRVAWSKQLRNLIADCETKLTSPDRHKVLLLKSDGDLVLLAQGGASKPVGYKVQPPAMASWAPNSSAFFINDGEGSGMSSILRIFRIDKSGVSQDDSINRNAVRLFREKIGCSSSTADPSVWGFGWSSDGKQVFLLVQATVNESCGEQGTFIGLIVNVADGSVSEQLTEEQTKKRFRTLLPRELYAK